MVKQLFLGSTDFAEAIFKIPQMSKHFSAMLLVKLILYDRRKYEPFQTKAFIEPEVSNFNPALMNMSLILEII